MKIEMETDHRWNLNRVTLVEEPGGMGDRVMICIHEYEQSPTEGTTVSVYLHELLRAAKMLAIPYQVTPPSEPER